MIFILFELILGLKVNLVEVLVIFFFVLVWIFFLCFFVNFMLRVFSFGVKVSLYLKFICGGVFVFNVDIIVLFFVMFFKGLSFLLLLRFFFLLSCVIEW